MRAKDLELAVPGTYNPDPSADIVRIESFGTHLQVINSKQRPRKMTIRGAIYYKSLKILLQAVMGMSTSSFLRGTKILDKTSV